MPRFCGVINCGSRGDRDAKSFFRLPAIPSVGEGNKIQFCRQKREAWLSAIKRADLTETKKKYLWICQDHFLSEFGVHLTELILDANGRLPIRQLASVLLRQYVESHWTSQAEKFRPPETTTDAKAAIRRLLPMGLQEAVSKLRSSVAYAIATIAHWDWPEAWPCLFEVLMQNLTSGNSYALHGSMRVLSEVSRDVSDHQMPQIAPVILPQMLKIFTDTQQYSIRTRGRAVQIFITCLEVIVAMADYNKATFKTLLNPILPQFTEALVKALVLPDGALSDSGLKKDVLNALKILIKVVPKQMGRWLPHILTPVWTSLTESANLYVKTVVNDTEEANNPIDSDGEVLGFENLVFSIFDFVGGLVESSKFRSYVQNGMADLLYYVVLYMQITEDQTRLWINDPDRFVEDEDDESFAYSVRISSQDLLMALGQEFEDETAASLCTAVMRHIQETKTSSNMHSWKIHESCMLALGSIKDLIISQLQNNNLQFDILGFLQSVVMEDLNTSGSPFLLGRCLWVASKYTDVLTEDMIHRFLQATVSGLQPTQSPCVRVAAVRATFGFCENLKSTNRESLLLPFLMPLIEGLLVLTTQFSAEVLGLVLETISMVLTVNDDFTTSIESKITPISIAVFLKYNSDPVLVSITQEIFKELCQHPMCLGPLQSRLLPTLTSILNGSEDKVPLGLQAVALDVLNTIVRSGSIPISEPLIIEAFPAACCCILKSDDNTILQNGSECLRAYISMAAEQLAAWHDEVGRNGLDYVINAIELILAPNTPESAAAFIGNLVSALVHKVGPSLGEKADLLLRAVLSKMQQVESLSVSQNLILVFAQLFRTQMIRVLDFLSGVPGPTGRSALDFVLVEWCHSHSMFFGAYEGKVSTFSLSQILEYTIKTNDSRLQEITVRGDPIYNPSDGDGVRTRSRTVQNPEQWTQVPLLVKIYKLLIQDLANSYESYIQCEDDESSDEDIDAQEDVIGEDMAQTTTQQLQFLDPENDLEVGEDDPDIIDDPLYKMNMKNYLIEFIQKLSQLSCYNSFSSHHTDNEKHILATYVRINV